MTTQQIQNAISICKGAPLSTIIRAFDMGAWNRAALEDMARYFNCQAEKTTVAFHLQMGE